MQQAALDIRGVIIYDSFFRKGFAPQQKRSEHQPARFGHDLQIQHKINVPYIISIPLITPENALKSTGRSTPSSYLGHTCYARPHQVTEFIIGYYLGEFTGILQHMGTRSDNAHMSQQHIDELG